MNKVILLRGLPASGKSSYAKKMVNDHPNQYKRVNRDSLRLMFNEEFNDKNEKFVLRVRDQIILQSLDEGFDVIVDDLNLSPKHEARIKSLVGKKAEVEIIDHFLQVPLDELLRRNNQRDEKVPDKVIRDLYSQFVEAVVDKQTKGKIFKDSASEKNYIPYDETLKDAVIFDIDGTLALMNGRSPFDWTRVGEDLVHEPVARMFQYFVDSDVEVFVVSGRDSVCRQETENWLLTYGLNDYSALYMRPEANQEKDSIIKERIYRERFEGRYNVVAVFDDRNQTVEKWRELGLLCLQVAPGNF